MQNNVKGRNLEWLLFNRKKLIGCYIVQFQCGEASDRIFDLGQITDIYATDTVFILKVDSNVWLSYLWDLTILPDVQEDDSNVIIEDKILSIRFIILKNDRPK